MPIEIVGAGAPIPSPNDMEKKTSEMVKFAKSLQEINANYEKMIEVQKEVTSAFTRVADGVDAATEHLGKKSKTIAEEMSGHFKSAGTKVRDHLMAPLGEITKQFGLLGGVAQTVLTGLAAHPAGAVIVGLIGGIAGAVLSFESLQAASYRASMGMRESTTPAELSIKNLQSSILYFKNDWHMSWDAATKIVEDSSRITRSHLDGLGIKKFTIDMSSMALASGQEFGAVAKDFDKFYMTTDMGVQRIGGLKDGLASIYAVAKTSALGLRDFQQSLMGSVEHMKLFGMEQGQSLLTALRLNDVMDKFGKLPGMPGGMQGASALFRGIAGAEATIANSPGALMFFEGMLPKRPEDTLKNWAAAGSNYNKEGIGSLWARRWEMQSKEMKLQPWQLGLQLAQELTPGMGAAQAGVMAQKVVENFDKLQGSLGKGNLQEIMKITNIENETERRLALKDYADKNGITDKKAFDKNFDDLIILQKDTKELMTPPLQRLADFVEKQLYALLMNMYNVFASLYNSFKEHFKWKGKEMPVIGPNGQFYLQSERQDGFVLGAKGGMVPHPKLGYHLDADNNIVPDDPHGPAPFENPLQTTALDQAIAQYQRPAFMETMRGQSPSITPPTAWGTMNDNGEGTKAIYSPKFSVYKDTTHPKEMRFTITFADILHIEQ